MKQKIQEYLQIIKTKTQKIVDKLQKTQKTQKEAGNALHRIKLAVLFLVPVVVLSCIIWFFVHYSVQNVIILGNVHYTQEEISHFVQRGIFGNNTLLVSRGNKTLIPEDMALVDRIDVEMKDSHTLQITVQERQLSGYVEYLDCYLYFDGDGRVMDSVVKSEQDEADGEPQALTAEALGKNATSYVAAMKDAPLIRGLTFSWAQMHEILPVEKPSVFNTILGISRMVNKYNIAPKAVDFDEDYNITIEYGDIIVNLGPDKLMEEKLTRVAAILPNLKGKHGMLHLEDYDGSSENIIFSELPLEAEGIEDESEEGEEAEYSHEYALAVSEHGNLKRKGSYTQQSVEDEVQEPQDDTQTGTTQEPLNDTQTGTTQEPLNDTQTGTTQEPLNDTQTGTTQQPLNDTQTETTQQPLNNTQTGTTQTSPQGNSTTQQIQIDKPVLNNLQ